MFGGFLLGDTRCLESCAEARLIPGKIRFGSPAEDRLIAGKTSFSPTKVRRSRVEALRTYPGKN